MLSGVEAFQLKLICKMFFRLLFFNSKTNNTNVFTNNHKKSTLRRMLYII